MILARVRTIGVFLAPVAAAFLFLPAAPAKDDIEISVREKKIENMSLEGLSLVFYLNINNGSNSSHWLAKYDYRLIIERTEYFRLETVLEAPIKIEAKRSVTVSLPVKITYELLLRAVPGVPDKDKMACFMAGGMTFQDERRREKRIQIAFAGEFPIFKGMTVECRPVEAKTLTIGGGDLLFKAVLKNPNGFDFKLEVVNYKLQFGGTTVSEGRLGQASSIPQRGEQAFSIPLLLDFFEIGKDIYDKLEQPPLPVVFSGEAVIDCVWGNFSIPFRKAESVDVLKIP